MNPAADVTSYVIYGPKQTWKSQVYLEGLCDTALLLDDPKSTSDDQKVAAIMRAV